jgi:hypothetical protein
MALTTHLQAVLRTKSKAIPQTPHQPFGFAWPVIRRILPLQRVITVDHNLNTDFHDELKSDTLMLFQIDEHDE